MSTFAALHRAEFARVTLSELQQKKQPHRPKKRLVFSSAFSMSQSWDAVAFWKVCTENVAKLKSVHWKTSKIILYGLQQWVLQQWFSNFPLLCTTMKTFPYMRQWCSYFNYNKRLVFVSLQVTWIYIFKIHSFICVSVCL